MSIKFCYSNFHELYSNFSRMVLICCFQHHSGTCDFNSYHEKQREQFVREDNPCSQTEAYSDQVGGNCELLKPGPPSSVVSIFHCFVSEELEWACIPEIQLSCCRKLFFL